MCFLMSIVKEVGFQNWVPLHNVEGICNFFVRALRFMEEMQR